METTSDPTATASLAPLPLADQAAPERADAARNREKVLRAAAKLFAERGAACVSMEAVAAEAGVGKGTLFRRFGDRASLARAVIGEAEAQLQDALIRGPAPLGPGAPPEERLAAFGAAYLAFLDTHADLMMAAEHSVPGFRYLAGPYGFYRTHVTLLLREAGLGPGCADYLSDVLLAPLAADAFHHHRTVRGQSLAELADGYRDLVRRILSAR